MRIWYKNEGDAVPTVITPVSDNRPDEKFFEWVDADTRARVKLSEMVVRAMTSYVGDLAEYGEIVFWGYRGEPTILVMKSSDGIHRLFGFLICSVVLKIGHKYVSDFDTIHDIMGGNA